MLAKTVKNLPFRNVVTIATQLIIRHQKGLPTALKSIGRNLGQEIQSGKLSFSQQVWNGSVYRSKRFIQIPVLLV